MESRLAYLGRTFERFIREAVQSVRNERKRVLAMANATGKSGNTLVQIKDKYDRAAIDTADKMVCVAFEITGNTAEPTCAAVEQGLTELRDALVNDLDQFFDSPQAGWAPANAINKVRNQFVEEMKDRVTAVVDDLRHGIKGGVRLSKDPLVHVVSTITNSPGAVLQSGVGNVQQATASANPADLRAALDQLLNSKEVQGLSPENRQSITDIAEVVSDELEKPQPDSSKVSRWGKRLVDVAERLGIAVAAGALSRLLLG